MKKIPGRFLGVAATASALLAFGSARADLAVTANDNHFVLVNGVSVVPANPAPDSATVIDLSVSPPRVVADISGVPGSVIGPPLSVALTPDEKLALITACMKPDPAHPGKQTEDNRMSVIDLTASPPRVIATLITGKGPSGVSINRQGTLALVTNRGDGSVSIFTIANQTVAPAGQIQIGNATSELAHVAFTVDGQHALVTRDGDNMITLLNVAGANVTLAGRDLRTGLKPYGIDVTPDGAAAVTTNTGFASGDVDTISVIDLHANPPRVVDVIPVGLTPEGVKISPDGKLCAITLQNGSNKPTSSPFYHDFGQLVLFRVDGTKLTRVADAPVGHWPQGIAFSADGKTILVCNMVEKNLSVFSWDGTTLRDTGVPIPLSGGAAAIRTAEK